MLVQKNMTTLTNIAVHHSGGVANDPYASSLHLTPQQISAYHRQRWDNYNPSMVILDDSMRWAGYCDIYDPKTRVFTHCRALGEETMAQYGHNFDTYPLCIIGNYSIDPATGKSVDPMTPEIIEDVSRYLLKMIEGDYSDIVVKPGTVLDFAISRTHPHRFYQQTECYGTSLSDKWIQDILLERKYPPAPVDADLLKKIQLLKQLVALYLELLRLKNGLKGLVVSKPMFGGPRERACTGFINLTS